MRVYFYVLIVLPALSGCGILKDTSKITDNNHTLVNQELAMQLSIDDAQVKKASVLTLYSDSSHQDYSVQVWPKGHFTFSATNGFEGEAEKLLIKGRTQHLEAGAVLSSLDETTRASAKIKVDQHDKLVSDQKLTVKKSTVSVKWVITGSLMLILIVFIFYKTKF